MKVLLFLGLVSACFAATIVDPEDCPSFPCMIFEDNFDFLDHYVWEHEITAAGGGNGEFQTYVNNRSTSFTRDSKLFIKPALLTSWKPAEFLEEGTLDLWGSQGINEDCTGPFRGGCTVVGTHEEIMNPIFSARLRSMNNFAFRYGTVEVRAKLPRGDWLWPAIWMLPERWPYGLWPASGEIDIMESRGNDNYGIQDLDNRYAGSTLHWGPFRSANRFELTTQSYTNENFTSLADDFNVWKMEWTNTSFRFYLNDVLKYTIEPSVSFFDYGGFPSIGDIDNPWESGSNFAPFDTKMYFLLNVAVGGTVGFFPDNMAGTPKPWRNDDVESKKYFWEARDQWLPTWEQGEGKISDNAALQIDYIRVYKMQNADM